MTTIADVNPFESRDVRSREFTAYLVRFATKHTESRPMRKLNQLASMAKLTHITTFEGPDSSFRESTASHRSLTSTAN